MAEIWGAAIVAVGAIGGAAMSANAQKNAANKAANASQNATDSAINQQNLNYNRTASNLDPYINAGNSALSQLQALNSGNYLSFQNSPGYAYQQQQGLQAVDRSAAAKGSLYSGGHTADVLNMSQGLANQDYNTYYGQIAALAGQGQGAASNLGSIGAGQSGAIGGYLQNNATNQTAAVQNNANANSQLINTGVGSLAQLLGNTQTNSSYGNTSNSGWNGNQGSYPSVPPNDNYG